MRLRLPVYRILRPAAVDREPSRPAIGVPRDKMEQLVGSERQARIEREGPEAERIVLDLHSNVLV